MFLFICFIASCNSNSIFKRGFNSRLQTKGSYVTVSLTTSVKRITPEQHKHNRAGTIVS